MAQPTNAERRDWMRLGLAGVGGAVVALAGTKLFGGSAGSETAAVAEKSRLRTVLERGKLIVGTGSTNAPWHFEDEKGEGALVLPVPTISLPRSSTVRRRLFSATAAV